MVRIRHDATGQVTTYYLHFTSVFVATGDWVDQNTLLGTAGDSGLSYPGYVHLHFELRRGTFPVDPVPLKACHGDELKSYPGEFEGKTSWSQVDAYLYAVRSDGTGCATGTSTTLPGGTTTTIATGTTTTLAGGTTTTLAGGTAGALVIGSASGYAVPNLTVFGQVPSRVPASPTPSVTLAADASNSPQTAGVQSAAAVFGPARLFTSGPITVHTEGSLAAGRSVASSTDIQSVNTSGTEVFSATALQSTCTASQSGVSGSTTITGGVLQTSEGDPDVGGDETNVTLPANPAPNSELPGQLETVGDTFEYVFNEQVINRDGSLTVYAAHLRLLGPSAVGDIYIGRVDCGVTATATTTTTLAGTTTTFPATTTMLAGTTTTVAGSTTTTVDDATTIAEDTTTTLAAATTTTTSTTTTGTEGSATTPTVGAGGGQSAASSAQTSSLARTGSSPQSLVVLALLMVVLGVIGRRWA